MPKFQPLSIDTQAGLKTLTLETSAQNTLNTEILSQIKSLVRDTHEQPEVRTVLIQSKLESIFSFGLDPVYMLERSAGRRIETFQELARMLVAIYECPVPVITDVSGAALAGGAVLASVGDLVLAHSTAARISYSETKVNLPMPQFALETIQRKAPPSRVFSIAMLGQNLDAHSAQTAGLVHEIYDTPEQRKELLATYHAKIQRLNRQVLAESLLNLRKPYVHAAQAFADNAESFEAYMNPPYLETGLKSLLKKP